MGHNKECLQNGFKFTIRTFVNDLVRSESNYDDYYKRKPVSYSLREGLENPGIDSVQVEYTPGHEEWRFGLRNGGIIEIYSVNTSHRLTAILKNGKDNVIARSLILEGAKSEPCRVADHKRVKWRKKRDEFIIRGKEQWYVSSSDDEKFWMGVVNLYKESKERES